MHKLMCRFEATMKKKIPNRKLDTVCPAGILCKKRKPDRRLGVEQLLKSYLKEVCVEGRHGVGGGCCNPSPVKKSTHRM